MKHSGQINRFYRVIWNAATGAWQAVSEVAKGQGKRKSKSKSKSSKHRRPAMMAGAFVLMSAAAYAGALPTGGTVVGGSATISQSGGNMTINQATARMAANWESFSIGAGNTVTFNQPSASSVALNRVVGADVSLIQGALKANGQVFLLNPNGVLFTPTAQVDVGGIVASTLSLSTANFMAGNYQFAGSSSNAIVNQGNITTANGGTIALIAAKITNNGTLTANAGNVLLGAGSMVTLDLGGPVKLQVTQGAIDALIQNGGAIKADGGLVYLTAKAAAGVSSTVINNTGVIEAQTLASGEKGAIYLLGDMVNGRIAVGGKLDASAPHGGDGGFIETSAAHVQIEPGISVSAASAKGKGGTWLMDPTDITISATTCTGDNCIVANTIAATLNGGTDVSIATSATHTGVERGDINVNAEIAWNQSTLSLTAHNDIWIRGAMTGTGSAKLSLTYGLTGGETSTYTVLGSLSLPTAGFSALARYVGAPIWMDVPVFLNNGAIRFGDGTTNSVDIYGSLLQPFYYNATDKRWYKLTYSDSPLYLNVGFGGVGYSDGTIITNQTSRGGLWTSPTSADGIAYFLSPSQNTSLYSNGVGTIAASNTVAQGGQLFTVKNTYTLRANTSYVEATTEVTNSGGSVVNNVRLWSGTRDDWIGLTDGPRKEKGNLVNGVFVPVTATGQSASVIRVTSDTEGILFYSTSAGADTTIGSCCRPNFQTQTLNVDGSSPSTRYLLSSPQDTPFITQPLVNNDSTDGNYSVYSNFGDLAASASKSIVWYYAAGDIASLASIASSVAQAAVAATATGTTLSPAAPSAPQVAAIQLAQGMAGRPALITEQSVGRSIMSRQPASFVPSGPAPSSGDRDSSRTFTSGGLEFLLAPAPQAGDTPSAASSARAQEGPPSDSRRPDGAAFSQAGLDPAGFMRVFVVGGGVRLSEEGRGQR